MPSTEELPLRKIAAALARDICQMVAKPGDYYWIQPEGGVSSHSIYISYSRHSSGGAFECACNIILTEWDGLNIRWTGYDQTGRFLPYTHYDMANPGLYEQLADKLRPRCSVVAALGHAALGHIPR